MTPHVETEAQKARREELQRQGRTFYSIRQFTKMLGVTRSWYYRRQDDPGMPQRVYFGDKPMLVYQECLDYIDRAVAAREKKSGPRRTKPRLVGRSGEEA